VPIGNRVADAANNKEIHQIGGLNERGDPIARERDAIIDIMKSDNLKRDIYFHDKKAGITAKPILVARGGKIVLKGWKPR
jgi:predicted mannosyl-3-phosphoglycerate phosphatase (HAD superfamily)